MPEHEARGAKRYRRGSHRAQTPAATLERVAPHLASIGLTRVANITGLDRIGIPVVAAMRPNSRSLAVFQGKGLDLDAARASAVMEALESWHAEHIRLPLRLGTLTELAGELPLVDVARLPRVHATPPDEQRPLLWIEGREIADGVQRWLPYECVHADYRVPAATGSGVFLATTNGLASGNERGEALSHALCEVIERDATALWRADGAPACAATRIDPLGVDDEDCHRLLARLTDSGFEVGLFDTTTDVGVASVYCVLVDARDREGHGGAGAGCHPCRGIALARAITEAVQVRTTYIAGARDDLERAEYAPLARTARDAEARTLLSVSPARRFGDLPDADFTDFDSEVQWLLARLRGAGAGEAVAVDLDHASIGVPVVRVVVPGLEGPDEVRGRLPGGERLKTRRGARQ